MLWTNDWLSLGQLGVKTEPLREHSLIAYLEQGAALYRCSWNSIPGREYSLLFLGYHFRASNGSPVLFLFRVWQLLLTSH